MAVQPGSALDVTVARRIASLMQSTSTAATLAHFSGAGGSLSGAFAGGLGFGGDAAAALAAMGGGAGGPAGEYAAMLQQLAAAGGLGGFAPAVLQQQQLLAAQMPWLALGLQGHAQSVGMPWGSFPLGAMGAGTYSGMPGMPAAPPRGALSSSPAAKPHDAAVVRSVPAGVDAELHRLQSGASELHRLQSGASDLHRLQSGASSRAVGPRVTFRGLPPSGANAVASPAAIGAAEAGDLTRMQSGASSRAGGDAPFPPRARLGFRVPPAGTVRGPPESNGDGSGAGQDLDMIRMQSANSASKATTGGNNASPSGLRKRKGRSSSGANAETGSQCSGDSGSSGGEGVELGARSGSVVGEGGEEGERTKRRLAQNREAARKSRQRRKDYVQKLEAEVSTLRQKLAAAAHAAAAAEPAEPARALPPRDSAERSADMDTGGPGTDPGQGRGPSQGAPVSVSANEERAAPAGAGAGGEVKAEARGAAPWGDALLQQDVEVALAFERWRGEHAEMGGAVRRALDAGAPADALRPQVEAVRRHLWTMFAMKRAVLCSDSAPAILRLEHLLPMERPFAWLGTLRPSDAAASVLAKLSGALPQAQRTALEALRDSLVEQEAVLAPAHVEALTELRARATAAPMPLKAGVAQDAPGAQPDVFGFFNTLRMLMMRADGVWEAFLEASERSLAPEHFAVAAIAYQETSLALQSMHLPWQAALRTPAQP
ncbi:hypothetical protein WJX81_008343 [Elliptochloris bilobata]|uniref:BZIP domain-containing protein n=1 Tax=Elliptochloris bilobata TaxID=381761 RepID=A0AAW1R9I3_9CHLO